MKAEPRLCECHGEPMEWHKDGGRSGGYWRCAVKLCKCHGEPMLWAREARKKAGGYWRCGVKKRAAQARHEKSEKGRASRARHEKSEKRRASRARHEKSEKRRASRARYNQSEKARAKSLRGYHAPYGGWYQRRKRHLSVQRVRILEQLHHLEGVDAEC